MPLAISGLVRIQDMADYGDAQTWAGLHTFNAGLTVTNGQVATIERINAVDATGLGLYDDGGNLGLAVEDGGQVGVNELAPGGQFQVTAADATIIGQIIKLAATPSASALEIQNSIGTILSRFRGDGGLTFGVGTTTITNHIYSNVTYSPTGNERYESIRIVDAISPTAADTTAQMRGAVISPSYSGTKNISELWGFQTGTSSSGSGNITSAGGGDFSFSSTGTGNITLVYGGRFSLTQGNPATGSVWANAYAGKFSIDIATNSDGDITNAYGNYVSASDNGTGVVTNLYGLYIADMNIGSTLNYAIYTNAGSVSLGGNLFLRTIKSGATQVAAGAAANEVWKTSGHASLPDNVLMIGV